ncbi:hypothetical protein ASALC70_00843 [Alcanivorax sp. ALC70]|nr:hypothetical protein ASALC70_00843 [Alcanivorax sp. ALC70]
MIPDFALARGHVWHRRYTPMDHRFRVPLWLVWSDVDAPDRLLAGHWLWGRRWRPVTFRDRDFVDASGRPLGDKVRERAAALGLDWSAGRVHMLGQWRTFGVLFNPLVLYFHFPAGAERPDSALAEVRNTPGGSVISTPCGCARRAASRWWSTTRPSMCRPFCPWRCATTGPFTPYFPSCA